MSMRQIIGNGVIRENPIFRLALGMCPTLAVTTEAVNGLSMGVATAFVLTGSNILVSLLKNFIPDRVRIPAFVVIVSTLATVVEMLMKAYVPVLHQALGLFIPLIAVNCVILVRAEAFASRNGMAASAADGLGMGLGFTLALSIIGMIREMLGNGTIFGVQMMPAAYQPALVMVLAPGGFLALGLTLGALNILRARREEDI